MTASLETLVGAADMFADRGAIPRPGPVGKTTDAELIALAVAQAAMGIPSEYPFRPAVPRSDREGAAGLVSALAGAVAVQAAVAPVDAVGRCRAAATRRAARRGAAADRRRTLLSCANYAGCASKSHFAGHAAHGYCPSKSRFISGMRFVLLCDRKDVPVGYDPVDPKAGRERKTVFERAAAHAGSILLRDRGLWGIDDERQMKLIRVELVTPERHKLGQRPPGEIAKARTRLVTESVFSNLKLQIRLSNHPAKTPAALAQQIAQPPPTLTLDILANLPTGRPTRALVAHNGHQTHISPLARAPGRSGHFSRWNAAFPGEFHTVHRVFPG